MVIKRFEANDLGSRVTYIPPYARNERSERQEGVLQDFDNHNRTALIAYVDQDGEYSAQTRYEDLAMVE